MLVVRRPKFLKSQSSILCLLQERNELPVVHEWDVHREHMDVSEQEKGGQDAKEN